MNLRSCPPVATWTPLPPDPPTAQPPWPALPVRLASKFCLDCSFQNFCLDWSGHRILLCVGVARGRAGTGAPLLPRGCRGATREERLGRCEGGSGGRLGHCVGMRPCAQAPAKPQARLLSLASRAKSAAEPVGCSSALMLLPRVPPAAR